MLTTGGAITLVFYLEHPYILYASWQLMGLASTMYIITNMKELCTLFPTLKVIFRGI